jgi:hypothetical protein
MHQAIKQARRQRSQRLQGAHVQDALLFSDFNGWMTNRHLAIAPGAGSGGRSELNTHVHFLHQGTPNPREASGAWQHLAAALLLLCLACIGPAMSTRRRPQCDGYQIG